MSNILDIITQKGQLSVQDLGRFTAQHLGFSASGVADEYAFLSGNKILHNHQNAAALEITFGQITFKVNCLCHIVITGADCEVTVNQRPAKHWHLLTLNSDDIIKLQAPKSGLYTYICVAGGIDTRKFLLSASELPKQLMQHFDKKIQINKGRYKLSNTPTVRKIEANNNHGSSLSLELSTGSPIGLNTPPQRYYFDQTSTTPHIVRYIPHQFWHQLTEQTQHNIQEQVYHIQAKSNKMGYRLKSAFSIPCHKGHLLSTPVTLGTIQVPNDGQPIILMKDRQTIGGYPTLGCIIQVDLPRLAQLAAHQRIKLQPTTIEHAQAQLSAFYQRFKNEE